MTWFFVLMVFGANGMAFEHDFAPTKASCEGKNIEARAAWKSGRHEQRGMGEILGMRSVCVPTPPELELRLVQRQFRHVVQSAPPAKSETQ